MWKTCFSPSQNAKNKESWNIKTKCVRDFLLTVRSSIMKDFTCHYVVSTYKTKVYINFNKIEVNFEIFCLHLTGYLNRKEAFSICIFFCLAKMWTSYIYQFFTNILTSTHLKKFIIFLDNICRDVQHSLFRSR